jgi:DNA polymerase-1
MKKLIVIDGFAILHRAYHALPPLNSKDGVITNAVYGFFSMFLKLFNDIKPEYITVCFDRPKPTFRKQMYVGYQAHRPAMDSDLTPQVKLVRDSLKKANIKTFELDGYEADDLIGTIAKQVVEKKENVKVLIVSGDRDLLQLVNEDVNVIAPITGITKMILFDSLKVEEKYGLKPHQFIDYKALVGDSSDNYPGVTGIGPKTACDLIKKFDTFENIYKNLGKVQPNLALKLATDAEQAAMAKKLATIAIDAPITFRLKDCESSSINRRELLKFFEKLGFKSLVTRFYEPEVKEKPKVEEKKKEEKKDEQLGLL